MSSDVLDMLDIAGNDVDGKTSEQASSKSDFARLNGWLDFWFEKDHKRYHCCERLLRHGKIAFSCSGEYREKRYEEL